MKPVWVGMYSVLVLMGSIVSPIGAADIPTRAADIPEICLQLAPPFVLLNRAIEGPLVGDPAMYKVLGFRGSIASDPSTVAIGIPALAGCHVLPPSLLLNNPPVGRILANSVPCGSMARTSRL